VETDPSPFSEQNDGPAFTFSANPDLDAVGS